MWNPSGVPIFKISHRQTPYGREVSSSLPLGFWLHAHKRENSTGRKFSRCDFNLSPMPKCTLRRVCDLNVATSYTATWVWRTVMKNFNFSEIAHVFNSRKLYSLPIRHKKAFLSYKLACWKRHFRKARWKPAWFVMCGHSTWIWYHTFYVVNM